MSQFTCGFAGLGLIGGSIAKALKTGSRTPVKIVAYDISRKDLALATQEGIVDVPAPSLDATFRSCDLLFLCAPVSANNENLLKLKKHLSADCIITDVGSVKTEIHKHIEAAGLSSQFIGGHPMAGSERTGYTNSKARLLENAYYILTPSREVSEEKTAFYQKLVESMGAIPLILKPEQHDYVTAAVSHLPHIIAASLVNLVQASDSEDGIMRMIAAGGFKDITRIASSSPEMWQQICLTNTDNISLLLKNYISSLSQIQTILDTRDSDCLYDLFGNARSYRETFANTSSGPIKKVYSVNLDIADEPGALASVATILALNHISIKNIGIIHNREFEEGALHIEFYEESAISLAKSILTGKGYSIYEKEN